MQQIRFYKGYRLEITSVAVDLIYPWEGASFYVMTKKSLREVMRFIRANPITL